MKYADYYYKVKPTSDVALKGSRRRVDVRWKAPQHDWICLNTDGALLCRLAVVVSSETLVVFGKEALRKMLGELVIIWRSFGEYTKGVEVGNPHGRILNWNNVSSFSCLSGSKQGCGCYSFIG
ncbi:hypothetical protein A2U01_0004901, partial [Trifolium medium]|nr:hypothetical protein [Trifolium medium]